MIDIHCHILPAVDDGPQQMEEAVAMARLAAADGITHIVATPHVNGKAPAGNAGFATEVSALNQQLQAAGVPVTILPGAEIAAVTAGTIDLTGLGLNHTAYLLVEFPHTHLPANAGELIFRLITGGYRPIIAHPERNPSIAKDPGKLMALRKMGAKVQITAASLTATHDLDLRHLAAYLVKKGAVDLIASDAHSATLRPPRLSEAFQAAAAWVGARKAEDLLQTHPLAVLKGLPIQGRR